MKNEISSVRVKLTPDGAKKLLGSSVGNRPIKRQHVKALARDMMAGRWVFNGQPIILSPDGVLLTGHHRCLAVVEANVAIDTLIVRGVADIARDTIDTGVSQSTYDKLHSEFSNAGAVIAGARIVMAWREGVRATTSISKWKVTVQEMRDFVDKNPLIVASAAAASATGTNITHRSVMTAFHFLASEVSPEDADDFVRDIHTGADLRIGDPVLALRNRLINMRSNREVLRPGDELSLLVRAWNHRMRGREMKRAQFSRDREEVGMIQEFKRRQRTEGGQDESKSQ